jgi:hypothetical protein
MDSYVGITCHYIAEERLLRRIATETIEIYDSCAETHFRSS